MTYAYIFDAIRTPFGRYGGALSSVRTDDLAAELLAKLGVPVGEFVAPLAGPQGLRLVRRIDAALRESACERRSARVRAIVPLFDAEVRGVPMLQRLCDAIYAADGAKPAAAAGAARPQDIAART